MKKSYMKTMDEMFIQMNRAALLYRDGKAWDNRKKKTWAKHAPRGRVYRRLLQMEWKLVTEPFFRLSLEITGQQI